uniref:SH3 domain-containing protein n=1 Tax=Caenorhabditis tropicalis TaxID=1561998 RepID=A0A1I7UYA1_9PELO
MKFDFSDGKRKVQFGSDGSSSAEKTLKPNGKVLNVSIGAGLPNTTRPSTERPQGGYTPRRDQLRTSTRRTNKTTYGGPQPVRSAPIPAHGINNNYNHQPPQQTSAPTPVSTNHQYSQEPARIPVMGNVINQLNNMNIAASGNSNVAASRGPPPARGPKPPPPAKPKLNPVVIAVYPYEAQDVDELSFEAGDEIELMNKDASGWWQGKINARVGLFPGNYVKE